MRRRDLIAAVTGALGALTLSGHAAQAEMQVVGFISPVSEGINADHIIAFQRGLSETGFEEGRNVVVEYRWADGRYERLPEIAAELVARRVAVICAASLPVALATKAATSTIPIVFSVGADPVKFGLVTSFNKPGRNATGIFQYFGPLGSKRLELLRELLPAAAKLAVLSNPNNQNAEDHLTDILEAAQAIRQPLQVLKATAEHDLDAAFADLAAHGVGGLLLTDDPVFRNARLRMVRLASHYRIPTIYFARDFVAAGGLISYGSDTKENYRQAGVYVGHILAGTRPTDLPISQPTKFELVINLRSAKELGLTIPPTLLARADEVIE